MGIAAGTGSSSRYLPLPGEKATTAEGRRLLVSMLDAVYVDAMKTKCVVVESRAGADTRIVNEPLDGIRVSGGAEGAIDRWYDERRLR